MPKIVPTKVIISPKATNTLECISPGGGTMNPAMSRAAPAVIIAVALTMAMWRGCCWGDGDIVADINWCRVQTPAKLHPPRHIAGKVTGH